MQTLVELAAAGDLTAVEQRWDVACQEAPTNRDALNLIPVVEALGGRQPDDRIATMLWSGLETLRERLGAGDTLPVAVAVLLKWPKVEPIRELITNLYRQVHAHREGLEALLEEAGVAGGRPPRRALRTLELLLSLEIGDYLVARDEAEAAQVIRIDPDDWNVTIRDRANETTFGPVELADDYERADADDYQVLLTFFPEQFSAMLRDDPTAAVACILKAVDKPVTRDELKDLLCPRHLKGDQWKAWWTKARPRIRKSAHVRINSKSPFALRYDPVGCSLDDTVGESFDQARSAADRWSVVEPYLRQCAGGKSPANQALLDRFRDYFRKTAEGNARRGNPTALTNWLQVREISVAAGDRDPDDGADRLLASVDDPSSYLRAVDLTSLWDSACDGLVRARPDDAKAILAGFLPSAPLEACDPVARRLAELGYTAEEFGILTQTILAEPARCADALLWLWSGPENEHARVADLTGILVRVLRMLGDLHRGDDAAADDARRLRGHARSVLAGRKHARFRECIAEMDAEVAPTVRTQLKRVDGLGLAIKQNLLRILDQRHPPKVEHTVVLPWEQDDVLYVTAAGLAERQAEYADLINVKMRENAIAIGDAAAHGDLSENSEYKFALEERDLLQARAAQMRAELSIASVLRLDEVPDSHVSPGCRATFRNQDDGRRVTLTFLGPWEANTEERIYNYKSPLAQSLMGLRLGQAADLNVGDLEGSFVLVSVEPAELNAV